MGKRGPAPKSEKSQVFSIRLRPDIRAALERESEATGKTLAQVITNRLHRTFVDDDTIADSFGDPRTFHLLRAVALSVKAQSNTTIGQGQNIAIGPGAWLSDPALFEQTFRTIVRILEAVRPPGPVPQVDYSIHDEHRSILGEIVDWDSKRIAGELWQFVQDADEDMPIDQGTRIEHRLARIKNELGAVASRPEPRRPSVDELKETIAKNTAKAKRLQTKKGSKP